MPGVLKLEGTNIATGDGNGAVTLSSGINFPTKSANTGNTSAGGHVLQVQHKAKTNEFSSGPPGSYNTFVAITGLDVKITPSSQSSKILVRYHINIAQDAGSHTGAATALYRNGSIITGAIGTSLLSSQVAVTTVALHYNHNDVNVGTAVVSAEFLDSPNSDAELTYQAYIYNASGSPYQTYVNRPRQNNNQAYVTKGASFITAMEIA